MGEGGWAVALAGAVMVEGAMAMAADSEGTAEALVVEGLVAEGLVVKTAEGLVPARPPPPRHRTNAASGAGSKRAGLSGHQGLHLRARRQAALQAQSHCGGQSPVLA